MKRFCLTCGENISDKRIDARYCSDACRKYFKRHGSRRTGITIPPQAPLPPAKPDKPGQVRTNRTPPTRRNRSQSKPGSNFVEGFRTVYRKDGDFFLATLGGTISLAGGYLEQKFISQLPSSPPPPRTAQPDTADAPNERNETDKPKRLAMRTAQEVKETEPAASIVLPDEWQSFLGSIVHPFKMLLWGPPGSGKSTYVLKLLDALNETTLTLYVSAEESLGSATLNRRIARTMSRAERTLIIEHLPETVEDWRKVVLCEELSDVRMVIAMDSLTALGMSPSDYVDGLERLRRGPDLSLVEQFLLYGLSTGMSQVWVAHAQKDGRSYLGDSSWAHDAEIVVKCEDGIATTTKNRLGEKGKNFKIY